MENKFNHSEGKDNLVIIPAYEPDESLLTFVRELLDASVRVLVVNDGSTPPHARFFDALPSEVIYLRYGENRGKGYAVKHAMAHVLASLPDVCRVAVADADGQHSTRDTLRVLDASRTHPEALVLGVRSFPENTPLRSRLGNWITAKLFQGVAKIKGLSDTQTGLRAFSRTALPFMLSVDGERYEYEMKQLLLWLRDDRPLIQVPIETIYRDKENSTSHYRALMDSARIFRTLFDNGQAILFAVSGFVSFTLDFALFNAFYFLMRPLRLAHPLIVPNVAARLCSCIFNFYINRTYVFESKDNLRRDALQYGLLVLAILTANNILLTFFGKVLNIHPTLAKLLVEITLFIISYLVQRLYIFSNKHLSSKK
ncbi:MAG: bifunctional glycosyltransferase family 2/GtrA family protein [Peptoniphilus sp.]|nr:bifunctional glycosyltransferase family 2/GtrA family protein [Peptoniphilus sp.]MDD7362615.1 bifunctional glycosyltransferase family 2/GtrA family protein [Bacillota bacterium]MDY6044986.1 bifunctional glycosyltransferase family 2/GtrA family protein [Peptoniphilus sp.]